MDVSQYLEIFIEETKEHLQTLNQEMLVLEKEPENQESINEIFRAAHSMKGMSGTMGFPKMQEFTHEMENVFSDIRAQKITVTADLVDILFKGLDALSKYLDNIIESSNEGDDDNSGLIAQLKEFANPNKKAAPVTEKKKAEPVVAEVTETLDAYKAGRIEVAEYEERAINKAYSIGKKVYGVTVYIQETCILKAARAFLVFKLLEEFGDIIKSVPSAQDIEDEKFDYDFSIFLVTSDSAEKVEKAIKNVSEIKDVYIGVI